jgi:hypothetical protein
VLSTDRQDYLLVPHIDSSNVAASQFNLMPIIMFSPSWLPEPARGVYQNQSNA